MNYTKRSLEEADEIEIDLRQILKVLRKRCKLIILITLLTTLASGLVSYYVLKPVYQAKTLLMVTVASDKLEVTTNPLTGNDPATGLTIAPMPVLTMNTYLGQLKSEVVMRRVITTLNLPNQTVEKLSQKTEISIIKDSNLIEVKANDTDPLLATNIANTISAEYLDLMKEYMFSSVVVISPASIPTVPAKPNKQMNIAIALILGLIVSSLLAFLLEYLDNTLKTADDVNRELNLPVLGIIPLRNRKNTRQTI
ncbi:MAG: Wzz/FepE/Etk N-terminal domain-containing protein [Syntrophomonadaceae bacterium]|nr:Wzz/FepE/Etk N-terminal domain-containing protein [Syntrophomonadaceae bacterium]